MFQISTLAAGVVMYVLVDRVEDPKGAVDKGKLSGRMRRGSGRKRGGGGRLLPASPLQATPNHDSHRSRSFSTTSVSLATSRQRISESLSFAYSRNAQYQSVLVVLHLCYTCVTDVFFTMVPGPYSVACRLSHVSDAAGTRRELDHSCMRM